MSWLRPSRSQRTADLDAPRGRRPAVLARTPQPSRDRLNGWLVGNATGGKRLRAGLPAGWRVGEKTGTGERGTTNDAGVLWPPEGAPQVVAVYLTGSDRPLPEREAAIAAVAKAVVET